MAKAVLEGRPNSQHTAAEALGFTWLCHAIGSARLMTQEKIVHAISIQSLKVVKPAQPTIFFQSKYYITIPTFHGSKDMPISKTLHDFLIALPRKEGFNKIFSKPMSTLLRTLYAKGVKKSDAEKTGFIADLAYKTRRLVEETVNHTGLGNFMRSITFDTQTLEALRRAKGANEGKVIDLVRGLRTEIDDNQDAAPILLPLKDRAERVLKDLESRKTTSMKALDLLATLAPERETATNSMNESGLSPKAFSIFWTLKEDPTLRDSQVNPMDLAKESEILMSRYPNANVNPEENRQLRTKLYTPLLKVKKEERNRLASFHYLKM